ncbi:MAG: 4-(cytidine 5'-diphospho)-2-C-methyl-D-erythritol kinase [Myxococcota bacterium]
MSGAAAPDRSVTLRAPAKVNLGLRLTGLREDGYHLLESLFVPLALADEIELRWWAAAEPGVALVVDVPAEAALPKALSGVTAGPDNLVVRAIEAFRAAHGLPGRVEIRLSKRIPAGAGLGGGSSDAGTVLAALPGLMGGVPPELAPLALELGADVPYFLAPEPALVTGIGERIAPVAGVPALDLVLVNPGISVATAEVYRVADLLRDSLTGSEAGSTMRAISGLAGETGAWRHALGALLVNDLAPAAIRLCPPIGRWLDRLREAGAIGVGMSGSGGTVFGVFGSAAEAERASSALLRSGRPSDSENQSSEDDPWICVTRVVARSRSDRQDPKT